jgi:acyl-CoA thioesterase YciA
MAVDMHYVTLKWVKPEDLNARGTLFGGSLLRWIDEEAGIYSVLQLGTQSVVTKYMSEISFESSAVVGDMIELALGAYQFGRTSITLRAEANNVFTKARILTIEKIVFVNIDEEGRPNPHGFIDITHGRDRIPAKSDGEAIT